MEHEVVIRLGRAFDVRTESSSFFSASSGFRAWTAGVREIRIPFADQESAEAALAEITLSVREVHDAGAEDYRPVVAGEVISPAELERTALYGLCERCGKPRDVRVTVLEDSGGTQADLYCPWCGEVA